MHIRFCSCSQEIAFDFRKELELLYERYAHITRKYEMFNTPSSGFFLEGGALYWFEADDPRLQKFLLGIHK